MDELFSLRLAQRGTVESVLAGLRSQLEENPPLYHLREHFWIACFGASELSIRLVSALAMTNGVLFSWCAVENVFGDTAALLAVATAIPANYLAAYAASEGRPYGLMFGLLGAGIWIAQKGYLGAEVRSKWAALSGLVMTGLVFSHHFWAALGVRSDRRRSRHRPEGMDARASEDPSADAATFMGRVDGLSDALPRFDMTSRA